MDDSIEVQQARERLARVKKETEIRIMNAWRARKKQAASSEADRTAAAKGTVRM
jgi:hypothetical protein